ncbi:hypothetical protein R1flu_027679 [Riccia fluitans]|uniref:Uncharacterized protein n=1 Tax=Riccia fluitans TaxID=41844 RepID=A0ABD1XMB8_9MARC
MESDREDFRKEVARQIGIQPNLDGGELALVVMQAAQTFSKNEVRSKQGHKLWFDEVCMKARARVCMAPLESRDIAFREYCLRAKERKRAYIRREQVRLIEELMIDPRRFWRRIKPKGKLEDLDRENSLPTLNPSTTYWMLLQCRTDRWTSSFSQTCKLKNRLKVWLMTKLGTFWDAP